MSLPQFDASQPLSIHAVRELAGLSAEQIDALPIGAIRTDREGVIRGYNASESALTGIAAETVLGRNFFTEVAPCTNVQRFAGRFRAGMAAGTLHDSFPYTFDLQPEKVSVLITMYCDGAGSDAWIFVSRLD